MNRHIDIRTISDYFLNRLSVEDETAVQEHLSVCPECRARLEAMRRLRKGIFEDEDSTVQRTPVIFRILRSAWTKAAAAVIIVCGIGLFTFETVRNRDNVIEQHQIQNARSIENEVFAIDTFDSEDSLYYHEKYGDDFLNPDSF